MRSRAFLRRTGALAALVTTLGASAPRAPGASAVGYGARTVLVLDDVPLIDGTGAPPRPHSRIVIAGRRLMAVGARDAVQVPEGATRLPVAGSWVLPGLVDLHAHVTFLRDPARFRDYDRATSEQVLRILLAHGITLARNPAAPATEGVALRDDLRAGRLAGPRLLTAGEAIDFGPDRTEDEVRAEVRRQAALGVDFIKVYARMPPSHVGAAVEEAHRRGLKVIGHLQATTAAEAARLGIDAITHATTWTPSLLPLSRRAAYEESQRAKGFIRARIDWLEVEGPEISDVVRAVAERHIPLDPTLIAYATKFLGDEPRWRESPSLLAAPAAIRETWKGALSDWTPADFTRAHRAWPKLLRLVQRYHEAGVALGAGSDEPNPWVAPGASLHDELELLVSAGLSPLDVLRIATLGGAEALGLRAETGSVEAGKAADLVVLGGDPVADIRNTRAVRFVIQQGRALDPEALLAQAGVPEAARALDATLRTR
jgi:imidazolonepropionase-like amidohydrolase